MRTLDQDDRLGRNDSFYSADITVAAAARAPGVGRTLKRAQALWAHLQAHGAPCLG